MGWLSAPEAAEKWGVTPQWVTTLCRRGLIKGSQKQAGRWIIPDDAPCPFTKFEAYGVDVVGVTEDCRVRPLPIGVSSFKNVVTRYEYVDKTLLIRDLLDAQAHAVLFCRPRRFGKTLNMDMLRTFFEKTDEDTSVYFRNTLIEQCGETYMEHQGKYPVVWLSFKDAKGLDWETCSGIVKRCLEQEMMRHIEAMCASSPALKAQEVLGKLVDDQTNLGAWAESLKLLTELLHRHYGVAPVVIIDEYDTPIQQGHERGYYDQAVDFMRTLMSGAVKDNPHLTLACLTGVLRVAKESVFSGLNNLVVCSVLDDQYARHFGFTHDEARRLLCKRNTLDKFDLACSWYDGYRFGESLVFNPWSILNFIANNYKPAPYWINTASNTVIHELVEMAVEQRNDSVADGLNNLLQGKSVKAQVDTSIIYPLLHANPLNLYSLLLVSGYLKAQRQENTEDWSDVYDLSIPNREVTEAFKKEIMVHLQQASWAFADYSVIEALIRGDASTLQNALTKFVETAVSAFDTSNEAFYHGLLLGLSSIMQNGYRITSNRESGKGRYDIQLAPKNPSRPGIVIEVKAARGQKNQEVDEEALNALADEALDQINQRDYASELRAQGATTILKYGVAFYKKETAIKVETE